MEDTIICVLLMAFDLQAFLINAYVTISIVFISKYHYRM